MNEPHSQSAQSPRQESLLSRLISRLFSEKTVLTSLCALLAAFSLWLQFVVLEDKPVVEVEDDEKPDYYVENFVAIGMDDQGNRRYMLEGERMVNYPHDDTAVLDKPHVVQYEPGSAPRHTYADSGWVGPDRNEVLLTGNVRVIQGKGPEGGSAGGVQSSERMRIRLKDKVGK